MCFVSTRLCHRVNLCSVPPSYLRSFFTSVADITSRRWLRSSTSHHLEAPPVRLSTVGKRAFAVSGAIVWNDLPHHVASAPSYSIFRQRLGTFLFSVICRRLKAASWRSDCGQVEDCSMIAMAKARLPYMLSWCRGTCSRFRSAERRCLWMDSGTQ